jgi:hypothetical protein
VHRGREAAIGHCVAPLDQFEHVDKQFQTTHDRLHELTGEPAVTVRDQIVAQDERSSEGCLHCEINDLVQEHIEGQEKVDIVGLAANMAESLVDLVLLASEEEQAKLLAVTISHLGHVFLEKSGAIEADSDTTH